MISPPSVVKIFCCVVIEAVFESFVKRLESVFIELSQASLRNTPCQRFASALLFKNLLISCFQISTVLSSLHNISSTQIDCSRQVLRKRENRIHVQNAFVFLSMVTNAVCKHAAPCEPVGPLINVYCNSIVNEFKTISSAACERIWLRWIALNATTICLHYVLLLLGVCCLSLCVSCKRCEYSERCSEANGMFQNLLDSPTTFISTYPLECPDRHVHLSLLMGLWQWLSHLQPFFLNNFDF